MRVGQFDFSLPEELIALRPVAPRDAARCMVVRDGGLEDRQMRELPELLQAGDLLVFNNTKVIPAALSGVRRRAEGNEARIHINLHKRISPDGWLAFARPLRRLRTNDEIVFSQNFSARIVEVHVEGDVMLRFNLSAAALDAAIAEHGDMPLPPYIGSKRPADAQDVQDYQALFAKVDGSVAAPTASLHFTEKLLKSIEDSGVKCCFVTLHVGAGTFMPVKADDTDKHHMHAEWGSISVEAAQMINAVIDAGGRVVAVGTTALRLLESASGADGTIGPWAGETRIFITPGYRFKTVDALITNFHLPKSTLFMLVSAFCGLEVMQAAYQHAIQEKYRFYSYGDGSLLFRAPQ
ncbi:MAG: tRNA preQ1(34) S-adenosylmethionine ribosyltransferase-isomerase QueA [Alphaproteobacteria bacterium]|nr:tRNA preQ1(34) S-adenosylmethionine ribosyltransferase-isomerase QueA [Alphaproteobacteria bacterium]